jgi:hypothetical protein
MYSEVIFAIYDSLYISIMQLLETPVTMHILVYMYIYRAQYTDTRTQKLILAI